MRIVEATAGDKITQTGSSRDALSRERLIAAMRRRGAEQSRLEAPEVASSLTARDARHCASHHSTLTPVAIFVSQTLNKPISQIQQNLDYWYRENSRRNPTGSVERYLYLKPSYTKNRPLSWVLNRLRCFPRKSYIAYLHRSSTSVLYEVSLAKFQFTEASHYFQFYFHLLFTLTHNTFTLELFL